MSFSDLIHNQLRGLGPEGIIASLQPLVDAGMDRHMAAVGAGRFYCSQVAALYQDAGRHLYTDEELAAGFLQYIRDCAMEYNNRHASDGTTVPVPDGITIQQCVDLYLASRGDLVRITRLYDDGSPEGEAKLYFRLRGAGGEPKCEACLDASNEEMVRFFSAAQGGSPSGFDMFLAVLKASAVQERLFPAPERAFLYWVSQKGLYVDEAVLPVDFLFDQYEVWHDAWKHCVSGFDIRDAEALPVALRKYGSLVKNVSAYDLASSLSSMGKNIQPMKEPGPCMRLDLSRKRFHLPGDPLDTKV